MILAIDPATETGTALITSLGEVVEACTFTANKKSTWGCRARYIYDEIGIMYKDYEDEITHICYEYYSKMSSPLIQMIPILAAMHFPDAIMDGNTKVIPSLWKGWWRKQAGFNKRSVKGVEDLEIIMPGVCEEFDLDDNSADAIMIGMAFINKRRGLLDK